MKLSEENEFSKHFVGEDAELFLGKAFDDETNSHFLVFRIPKIEKLNVAHIQYPISFETSMDDRDQFFKDFDDKRASEFLESVMEEIERRNNSVNEKKEENEEKL